MLLKLSVKDCVIPHICDCKTASKILKTLKDLYEVKDTNRLLFLRSKILSIKMEENETVVAFISRIKELKKKLDTLFVDSGASIHMTRNKQWFEDFKETSSGANIYLGDDIGNQIKDYGNIPVVLPNGNIRHIHNVMYVLGIKKNLIFVSTIIDQNLKVELYKSYCVIKDLLACMKPIASGFSDSDWAGNVDDRRSIIGYAFSIGSGVITWSSKKQNTVSLSFAEAEYQAMCSATCQAVWLRRLLLDVGEEQKVATVIKCDNQSSIKLANNLVFHMNTKHIDTQFHFVREKVQSKEIHIEYCNSCDNADDIFIKPLGRIKFELFREV
eukprot:PITA_29456